MKTLIVLISRVFNGCVHFSREYFGKTLVMGDGKTFCVIRDIIVDPMHGDDKATAVCVVRFKFSGLPLAVNKRLSFFPAPFLAAKAGFRRKIWTVSDDGYFRGIYQWSSKESAESYPQSFIFKMMVKRSAEGTLSYEIIPDMDLSEFIKNYIRIKRGYYGNKTFHI